MRLFRRTRPSAAVGITEPPHAGQRTRRRKPARSVRLRRPGKRGRADEDGRVPEDGRSDGSTRSFTDGASDGPTGSDGPERTDKHGRSDKRGRPGGAARPAAPAGKHGLGRGELGLAVTAIPSVVVRPGMTIAEAEAARRPPVAPVSEPREQEPDTVGTQDADAAVGQGAPDISADLFAEVPPLWSAASARSAPSDPSALADSSALSSPSVVEPSPPAIPTFLPAAQNVLPGAPPPIAIASQAAPAPQPIPVAPEASIDLLDWFAAEPAHEPAHEPAEPPTSSPPASSQTGSSQTGSSHTEDAPVSMLVQPGTAATGPRVELGFRDGSRTQLDPAGEQAQALEELARTLTGF